jgi:hypothetical protein
MDIIFISHLKNTTVLKNNELIEGNLIAFEWIILLTDAGKMH